MSRLAVDRFGQIYQTSPDREDGLGYGSRPECVTQGDLTLGSAYLKSQSTRQQDMIKLRRDNRALEANDEMTRRIANHNREVRRQKEQAEINMIRDPKVRDAVLREAMGRENCSCEYSTPMSGNVMTANGQYGWNGLTRDQQVISHVTMGKGSNVAHHVDPQEMNQHRHRLHAEKLMRLKARR